MPKPRKALLTNKVAMTNLVYMAGDGRSYEEIQKALEMVLKHEYSISAIKRNCILKGFKDSSSSTTTLNKPRVKYDTNYSWTKKRVIYNYYRKMDQDILSFGQLCEHTASFFDEISQYPIGENAPQEFWNEINTKIAHWGKEREQLLAMSRSCDVYFNELTPSQKRAYYFCDAYHERKILKKNIDSYGEVYDLYRGWHNWLTDKRVA